MTGEQHRASVFGGNGGLRTAAAKGHVGAVVIPISARRRGVVRARNSGSVASRSERRSHGGL